MFVKKHGQRLRSIKSTDNGIKVTPEVFEILSSFNVDSVFLAKCLCNSWQNLKSDWTRSQFDSCLKSITCTLETVNVISETLSDLLDDVDIEPLLNRFLVRMVPLQIQSSTATLNADVANLRAELVELKKEVGVNPRGITGLSNIENTCFMNSIIQSISHCVDLTEFVLSDEFKRDLNKNNSNGSKGKIALAWRETVQNLWNGKASVYTPTKLKHEVEMMASQLLKQHDSQEFLSFLLDNLQKDLNRVRQMPNFDIVIDSDQEEFRIAEESIQRFNAHNQSRVGELFTSLYRSKLKCPTCKKTSVTFTTTNQISVPIPAGNIHNIEFSLQLLNVYEKFVRTIEFKLPCPVIPDVTSMKMKISKHFNLSTSSIFLSRATMLGNFSPKSDEDHINIQWESHFDVLICYELQGTVLAPIIDFNQKRLVIVSHQGPKPSIFQYAFPQFETTHNFLLAVSEENNTAEEIKCAINVYNQTFLVNGWENHCEIKVAVGHTAFHLTPIEELSDAYLKSKRPQYYYSSNSSPINVKYQWKTKKAVSEYIEIQFSTEVLKSETGLHSNSQLSECLDLFCQPETLDETNEWFCPKCKEHKKAEKKFDIYRASEYLIVHLKRFKDNSKIEDLVEFPLKGLDISKYVLDPQQKGSNQLIYDLIAVTNHEGNMDGGHSTAYVYNPEAKGWYEMDDSKATPLSPDRVCSRMAYVLIYKRR
ncbi:hypothetical protein GEMRC1_012760 [Eukaryota sp. GEM-RC1]